MADHPHFGFPYTRGSVVEQDSHDHVMSCENVIVRCPQGWRDDRPDFGVPYPEFAVTPISPADITAVLRRLEPRGDAQGAEYADAADASIRHLTISVEITT